MKSRAAVRFLIGLTLSGAGCAGDERQNREVDTAAAGAAAFVDSAVPRDEALRRFRTGLAPVAELSGLRTRDSLVRAFVAAVAQRDSGALRRLMLNRAEFAYLVYPTSPQGLPPYDLAPELMWDLLVRQSDRGLHDALTRVGGKELVTVSHDCGDQPAREGDNLIWGPCTITLTSGADTVATRLTGPIVERAGRFKFVSYTNDLD